MNIHPTANSVDNIGLIILGIVVLLGVAIILLGILSALIKD